MADDATGRRLAGQRPPPGKGGGGHDGRCKRSMRRIANFYSKLWTDSWPDYIITLHFDDTTKQLFLPRHGGLTDGVFIVVSCMPNHFITLPIWLYLTAGECAF